MVVSTFCRIITRRSFCYLGWRQRERLCKVLNLIYSEIIFQRFIRLNIYENRTHTHSLQDLGNGWWLTEQKGRWLTERKALQKMESKNNMMYVIYQTNNGYMSINIFFTDILTWKNWIAMLMLQFFSSQTQSSYCFEFTYYHIHKFFVNCVEKWQFIKSWKNTYVMYSISFFTTVLFLIKSWVQSTKV